MPVIVVGNITVGGSGKTPLTIALASELARRGWRPGIVSRGYRATSSAPRAVGVDDDPDVVGDEPLLLARTGLPVWIGADRPAAARALLAAHPDRDLIIADDGLQHYALARDIEIAVIDASRGLGNGLPLPAGPLREPAARLGAVDAIVHLGGTGDSKREFAMTLAGERFVRVNDSAVSADAALFRSGEVHADRRDRRPGAILRAARRAWHRCAPPSVSRSSSLRRRRPRSARRHGDPDDRERCGKMQRIRRRPLLGSPRQGDGRAGAA